MQMYHVCKDCIEKLQLIRHVLNYMCVFCHYECCGHWRLTLFGHIARTDNNVDAK